MEIKVLGAEGCQVCTNLQQTVINVLSELKVPAAVSKVVDVDEVLKYDVYSLPGLVINEQVMAKGRVPSKSEIINWVKEATKLG